MSGRFQDLFHFAATSLRANIVQTAAGPALRAGGHQFASLWTRDFCFAAKGLAILGERTTLENHLQLLISSVREDGAVPRILDDQASAIRVLRWTLGRRILPRHTPSRIMRGELHREYLGEHKTLAMDSGALLFLAVFATWPERASLDYEKPLKRILAFYSTRTADWTQPLKQAAYSDWQDSGRRVGAWDMMHVLLMQVLRLAEKKSWVPPLTSQRWSEVFSNEFQAGLLSPATQLHASTRGRRQVSLESHCWRVQMLLEDGKIVEARSLWQAIQDHPIYHRSALPGVPVDPEYPSDEISFFTKAVGLRHYHDRLSWTWLAAEVAKTAQLVGDGKEAERILSQLNEVCGYWGEVPEVLDPVSGLPFQTWLYVSESPFSWAAGKILEALAVAGHIKSPEGPGSQV